MSWTEHGVQIPDAVRDFDFCSNCQEVRDYCNCPGRATAPTTGTPSTSGSPTVDSDPLPAEPLTELGHARRLVAVAGHRLRWVPAWRRWLIWDGRRWAPDTTGAADRAVKEVIRAVTRRCAESADDGATRQAALRAALKLESAAAVRGTLTLAGTKPGIAVAPEKLDAHCPRTIY